MVYNDTHGMLAVTQPSFTSLAPGYGVRRVNMLELRVGKKKIGSGGLTFFDKNNFWTPPTKHVPLIFDLQKNMYHFIGNLFEIWHSIHSCKTSFFQCHKTKQLELQILVPVLKFNAINVAQKLGHAAGIETLQQHFLLVRNEAKYICLTPEIRLELKRA